MTGANSAPLGCEFVAGPVAGFVCTVDQYRALATEVAVIRGSRRQTIRRIEVAKPTREEGYISQGTSEQSPTRGSIRAGQALEEFPFPRFRARADARSPQANSMPAKTAVQEGTFSGVPHENRLLSDS
jgi:hypothetical protein